MANSTVRSNRKSPYKPVHRIEVFIWNRLVGAVALDPRLGYYVFAFDPKFRKTGMNLSPLRMSVQAPDDVFVFTDLPVATYKRLPAMLADALPDDFGNALINRYMADQGIPPENITALDRLAYMGTRAMGALSFKPGRGPRRLEPTAVSMGQLVSEARKAVSGHWGDDHETSAAWRSIIDVGTSAGGARAKAVVAWNPDTDEMRSGQLDAPPGFEHWLLKFDGMGFDSELGASQDYGRIEYAYHLMARDAGIAMTDCRLLLENGRAHFMTRRFDRDGAGTRHHVQTLCAMSHLDYKLKGVNAYSQLFLTIQALGLGYEAMEEAFRRMVFNIMARNCDDHAKNFAFRLKEGQAWELAPAYDVTFAHNPQGEWTHQHLMSANGKFKDFSVADLLAEAQRFGVGTAGRVIGEVAAAVRNWPGHAAKAGLGMDQVGKIGGLHLVMG